MGPWRWFINSTAPSSSDKYHSRTLMRKQQQESHLPSPHWIFVSLQPHQSHPLTVVISAAPWWHDLERIHVIHPRFLQGLKALILVFIAHFCFLTRGKITKTTDKHAREGTCSMATRCQGYRLGQLTARGVRQVGAMLCLNLTAASSTSQLCSLEQHTFSFETRKTNVIVFSFPEMSNSRGSQIFLSWLTAVSQGLVFGPGLPKG